MSRITLILGGARSGKSRHALKLAKKYKKVAFVATCQGKDKEMLERIKLHKETRPKNWKTFEEPMDLEKILSKINNDFDCIVIDCLTLLVSNLILSGDKERSILEKTNGLLSTLEKSKASIILVSNEVGLGLVPANRLGRDFRDIAGKVNQIVASRANKVLFMVAGLPMNIKGKVE